MSDAPVEVTPKRFIAGAVCPACSEMDSIKMWNCLLYTSDAADE